MLCIYLSVSDVRVPPPNASQSLPAHAPVPSRFLTVKFVMPISAGSGNQNYVVHAQKGSSLAWETVL